MKNVILFWITLHAHKHTHANRQIVAKSLDEQIIFCLKTKIYYPKTNKTFIRVQSRELGWFWVWVCVWVCIVVCDYGNLWYGVGTGVSVLFFLKAVVKSFLLYITSIERDYGERERESENERSTTREHKETYYTIEENQNPTLWSVSFSRKREMLTNTTT